MKVKTSVTLSSELLEAIAAQPDEPNRSAFIEEATWRYVRMLSRRRRDLKERKRIDEHSDELNEEALDTLDYQGGT